MHYELRTTEGSRDVVATADLPDQFAAENWAKDWVRGNDAQGEYLLQGKGGDFRRSLFKTQSGHWYLTPASMETTGA